MGERLRLLGILMLIVENIQFFRNEIEKVNRSIIINVFRKGDFDPWYRTNEWENISWMMQNESVYTSYLQQGYTNAKNNLIEDCIRTEVAGFLPPPDSSIELNDTSWYLNNQIMLRVISGPISNSYNILYAIFNALFMLGRTLCQLQEELLKDRTPIEYASFARELYKRNTLKYDLTLAPLYNEEVSSHCGELTHGWYRDYIDNLLKDLFDCPFMKCKMANDGYSLAQGTPIIHKIEGVSHRDLELFNYSLSKLCRYQDGYFFFDENYDQIIGELIYKKQRKLSPSEQIDFFKFRYLIELVQSDLRDCAYEEEDIFPPNFDFSTSILEDRVNKRRVYSKLYKLIVENNIITAKKHWFIVFAVFKQKGWLKADVQTRFCLEIARVFAHMTNDSLFQPTASDFKEVDTYFKKTACLTWNPDFLPNVGEFYQQTADLLYNTFEYGYLVEK